VDGSKVVGIFNRFDWPQDIEGDFAKLGFKQTGVKMRDFWAGKDMGRVGGKYTVHVPGHVVLLLKVAAWCC
jgi:hypothetical protein